MPVTGAPPPPGVTATGRDASPYATIEMAVDPADTLAADAFDTLAVQVAPTFTGATAARAV